MTLEQAAEAAVAALEISDIEQPNISGIPAIEKSKLNLLRKGLTEEDFQSLVDFNEKLASPKIKTTFLGITPSLIKDGQADLRGRTVSGARELAAMSQVFSNPQFETLRIVYLKGRTIVHHEGVTSRLPSQVKTFAGDEKEIEARRKEVGADAVYLVHNHPSGDPTPSKADIKATGTWGKTIQNLRGHVVINSEKFAFINPSGQVQEADIQTDRPDLEAAIPNKIVTQRIKTPSDIADLSKRMQNPKGFINAVFLSTKKDVRSLQEIPI
ncbi:MAG: hypothetical protein GY718_14075, partial [Lentisphaerae bacterium]|nr:hypothetical protein [Lentisphaerota bacterium]